MREIVVISGKGGTGKTSLTGAFAHLSSGKIICDLDVDAPDLHLILKPVHRTITDFYSGHEARILPEACDECGICEEVCRFGAVQSSQRGLFVDPLKCEGCKVCVALCPADAIAFDERHCGHWYRSETRFGPMIHAQLFPGDENSGRLVALLRQKAREVAVSRGFDLILCDGAPGIGCPVISSLTGTDLAVLVTEPTLSGIHDLERVAELCSHFGIPAGVVLNKSDLNPDGTRGIEDFCLRSGLTIFGEIPHDPLVVQAMVRERVVTEIDDKGAGHAVRQVWDRIAEHAGISLAA